MLTLSEFKKYIKIDGNDNNAFFQSCIDKAISNMESKCSRNFIQRTYTQYITFTYEGYDYDCLTNNRGRVFLSNTPIISVTSIEELEDSDGTYSTIFTTPDTIANSTIIKNNIGEVSLLKSYSFPYGNDSTKIVYSAGYKFSQLTGTVSNSANSQTVTGVGTLFTTELVVGDYISIGIEKRKVTAIASATSLTVDFNIINVNSAVTAYINNFPDDLIKFCLELATWIYYQSPQSAMSLLGVTSKNQGGQSSVGQSFQEPNWTDIINNYRVMNV